MVGGNPSSNAVPIQSNKVVYCKYTVPQKKFEHPKTIVVRMIARVGSIT